jgi:hypothetical protein
VPLRFSVKPRSTRWGRAASIDDDDDGGPRVSPPNQELVPTTAARTSNRRRRLRASACSSSFKDGTTREKFAIRGAVPLRQDQVDARPSTASIDAHNGDDGPTSRPSASTNPSKRPLLSPRKDEPSVKRHRFLLLLNAKSANVVPAGRLALFVAPPGTTSRFVGRADR